MPQRVKQTKRKTVPDASSKPRERKTQPPGRTVKLREDQIIAAAHDLAEKQIQDGTVSSQVLTHFLKLGSSTAKLEAIKLEHENQLLKAKTESLTSRKRIEELYIDAMKAMKTYQGSMESDNKDDSDGDD